MDQSELDLTPIKSYLSKVSPQGRTMLLPALHYTQGHFGWIPKEAQLEISNALRIPTSEIHGVIEFYSMFFNVPTPKRVIRVCEDPACSIAGAEAIISAFEQLKLNQIQIKLEPCTCLGMCESAPAILDDKLSIGNITPLNIEKIILHQPSEPPIRAYGHPRLLLKRVGKINPNSINDYEKEGGFKGLQNALMLGPEQLIETIEASGVLGRGGAMFPVGRKWRFTREAFGPPHTKHIVVNADESEPGTFKDRYIMENDPYSILEAAIIAGYAAGAENGWIFVRGEYPRSFALLSNAIKEARIRGYLGKNILGKANFNFDIEIRLGAGAYICGEETALFEAIEGKRGFPRIKPPFPTTNGLFFEPTSVNNVETLLAALTAFNIGIESWKSYGTKNSPGTKLFCLSGHINNPGLYEVPFGLTIRELIEKAGGVKGEPIKAVLIGGAAGVFIGPDNLDFRLTYEDAHANGTPLGSGVIMVFNESVNMNKVFFQISRFFAHESCGKCFPCQLGTQKQMEILKILAEKPGARIKNREDILDIGVTMTEASICGLGQTAGSAVLSALNIWPELFE